MLLTIIHVNSQFRRWQEELLNRSVHRCCFYSDAIAFYCMRVATASPYKNAHALVATDNAFMQLQAKSRSKLHYHVHVVILLVRIKSTRVHDKLPYFLVNCNAIVQMNSYRTLSQSNILSDISYAKTSSWCCFEDFLLWWRLVVFTQREMIFSLSNGGKIETLTFKGGFYWRIEPGYP